MCSISFALAGTEGRRRHEFDAPLTCQHTAADIGKAQDIEKPLKSPILTWRTMQNRENDVRSCFSQSFPNLLVELEYNHVLVKGGKSVRDATS